MESSWRAVKRILKSETCSEYIADHLLNVDSRPLSEEKLNMCDCSWYEDESGRSKRIVSLVDSHNETYEGTAKLKENICKTVLVLHNKNKNKVQMIELSECQLGKVFQKPNLQSNYDNDEITTTYEDNRNKLLKAFGSKRSNRVSEIGSKMKINSEMMTTQIKHTAADVSVDVKELEMADLSVDTCLPPCHRDATNVEGIYRLEDFFTESEMNSMEDEAIVVFNLMPFTQEESGYSKLFIDSLERLQNKVSIERIKCLLFVDALVKFFNCPLSKLKKKDVVENVCPFSNLIAKKIFENFTIDSAGGRIRNVTMDDKIVIHIIVLIIIACDFSCNTEELSRYLPRFSVKKIGEIARALCLSTRDKVTWFLRLPLPPPRSVFMRRRK